MVVMLRVNRPNGKSSLWIPDEGVYDNNGYLFHHTDARPLLPIHRERLEAHGIFISTKNNTKEEDLIIRANWNKFRKEHNMEEMDILKLVGVGAGSGYGTGKGRNLSDFRRRTNLWPRLCEGLPQRCAWTVKYRIMYVYDPYTGPAANRGFTEEDDIQLLQLRKLYTESATCELTGRSFAKVRCRYTQLCLAQQFSHSERRKLWNIVAQCHPEMMMEEWEIPTTEQIDWTTVSSALPRSKETLRKEWKKMEDEMRELKEEGDLSFEEALEEVAPKCPRISAADFSEYLLILLHQNPSIDSLNVSSTPDSAIGQQMKKHGITGFLSERYSEPRYCRLLLGRILRALRRRLLRPSSLRLSLSTQIRLLSHSFRCLPQATQSNGPLRLDRNHVIRQIEKLMKSDDSTWKMSRKMKKYIEEERK